MRRTLLVTASFLFLAVPTLAQQRFDLGLRGGIHLADGEPANDIPFVGLFGHYRWSDRWALGLAIDRAEYDFEQPARLAGLEQDPSVPALDASSEATTVSAWIERRYGRSGGRGEWFWGAGLGLASIDVPDVQGPLAGGGSFDVRTDAGTEIVVFLLGGRRFHLGGRFSLELAIHADQHFADWTIEDRVSGARGSVEDYFTYGGHVGLSFRF